LGAKLKEIGEIEGGKAHINGDLKMGRSEGKKR